MSTKEIAVAVYFSAGIVAFMVTLCLVALMGVLERIAKALERLEKRP